MKMCLAALSATALLAASQANAALILSENFDASTSLPAGWSSANNVAVVDDVTYAQSGTNALWIVETRNSNIVTAPTLNLTGATEATISFYWTTDAPHASKFGRAPQVQYTSDGSTWLLIGSFTVPSGTTEIPPFTLFSKTITSDSYSFTANSAFRIVGDNDSGGSGAPAIIDDFAINAEGVIPEPGTLALLGLGGLMIVRRRRA